MEPARELKVDVEVGTTPSGSGAVGEDGRMCWMWRFLWKSMMWQFSGSTEIRGGSSSFAAAQRK